MPNTALLSNSLNRNKFKKGTSNLRSYRNYTKKNKSTASNTNENEIKLILTVPENQLHQTNMSRNSYRTSSSARASSYNANTFGANQAPMYDFPVYLTKDNESYNDGSRSIEQSEKRASYYLQHLKEYYIAQDDKHTVPDEQIEGLLVHFPNQRPMAYDSKTTYQHGLFDIIRGSLSEENKPMLLITHKGLQEVSLEDINHKYKKILSKLFLS